MNATGSLLSHHKQQIWVYVIAGLFVCDFVLCGFLPSRQRLTSLQRAWSRQRQTIQMAATRGAELPDLQARLRDLEKAVEHFELRVPPNGALGAFLQQISGIMSECHLTDQVVLPGKELTVENLLCIPVHVSCKGTLTDLSGFFGKLQAAPRLVRLERVVFENDSDLTGRISLQMEVVIFEQLPESRRANGPAARGWADEVNHGA
jgi:Tfp pilus assembly protein PilO